MVRVLFLVCGWPPSCCIITWHFLCMCTEREISGISSSSYGIPVPSDQGPTLMTSFNILKALSPSTMRLGLLHKDFGGHTIQSIIGPFENLMRALHTLPRRLCTLPSRILHTVSGSSWTPGWEPLFRANFLFSQMEKWWFRKGMWFSTDEERARSHDSSSRACPTLPSLGPVNQPGLPQHTTSLPDRVKGTTASSPGMPTWVNQAFAVTDRKRGGFQCFKNSQEVAKIYTNFNIHSQETWRQGDGGVSVLMKDKVESEEAPTWTIWWWPWTWHGPSSSDSSLVHCPGVGRFDFFRSSSSSPILHFYDSGARMMGKNEMRHLGPRIMGKTIFFQNVF